MCLAPYAAFVDDELRYLCESVRVRILSSLTSLKLIKNSAQDSHRRGGVLLVGDPCVEDITNKQGETILSPLPYAREEVMTIGEMLGVVSLTGNKQLKRRF